MALIFARILTLIRVDAYWATHITLSWASTCATRSAPIVRGVPETGPAHRLNPSQGHSSPAVECLRSTYCGRSRPRPWTPQLGGERPLAERRETGGEEAFLRDAGSLDSALSDLS